MYESFSPAGWHHSAWHFPATLVSPKLSKAPRDSEAQSSSLHTSQLLPMMSNGSPKRVGGEYGELHANIDIDKLNAYLVAHVSVVSSPVDVQQFKVRSRLSRADLYLTFCSVWTGMPSRLHSMFD
jgi:hypothetical protein